MYTVHHTFRTHKDIKVPLDKFQVFFNEYLTTKIEFYFKCLSSDGL